MKSAASGEQFQFHGNSITVHPSQKAEIGRLLKEAGVTKYVWLPGIGEVRPYSESEEYDYTPVNELLAIPDKEDREALKKLLDAQ